MRCRVLHIEDEPDIREVVQLSLSLDPGWTVKSVDSACDGLKQAGKWKPDLILMDAVMPGMDGPQLLARLQENDHTAKIPVVFMTARAQSEEAEHFIGLGAAGVIAKPFDPLTLAASLRAYLDEISRAA